MKFDALSNIESIFITLLVSIPFGKIIFSVLKSWKNEEALSGNCTPCMNSILLTENCLNCNSFTNWNHLLRSILPFPCKVRDCEFWSHTPCTAPKSKFFDPTVTSVAKIPLIQSPIDIRINPPTIRYFLIFIIISLLNK